FAWALDHLGAWRSSAAEVREQEMAALVKLLAFNAIPIPHGIDVAGHPEPRVRLGGGTVQSGREAVLELLESAANEVAANKALRRALVIFSSIGFRSGQNPTIAEGLKRCVREGIHVVFVVGADWKRFDPDVILGDLQVYLEEILEAQERAKIHVLRVANRHSVTAPASNPLSETKHSSAADGPRPPSVLASRFARIGIVVNAPPTEDRPAAETGAVWNLHNLSRATVHRAWVEVTGGSLSVWVDLPDAPEFTADFRTLMADLTRGGAEWSDLSSKETSC
ncbi:MAG TPA: hypothetical protein VEA69_26030, partial [Tepidisphaeraceae bacterium]|nr:hypothetical protein [Tepidisphaeraceae bacterium]